MNRSIKYKRHLFRLCVISLVVLVMYNHAFAQDVSDPGFSIGTVSGAYQCGYNQSPGQLTELHPIGLSQFNLNLSYQWYSAPYPTTGFTAISGATNANYTVPGLTRTTYYRLVVTISFLGFPLTVTSNTIRIRVVSPDWQNINYLRQYTVLTTQNAGSVHAIEMLPIGKKIETTTYLNGLGRVLEKINKGVATPQSGSTWGDKVSFSKYDSYGRQPRQYLPYTSTSNPGKYKTSPLTAQEQYYSDKYNDSIAYARITYDNSPVDKVKNVKEPGAPWAASTGKTLTYSTNSTADNVQMFSVDYVQGDPPEDQGAYPANTLYKQSFINESGEKVVEYTNKSGQLILKKIQQSSNPSASYSGWMCVYSIYDDFGLLRYRLQPKAVAYLAAHNWSFAGTSGQEVLNRLCFQYDYDDEGRVIWKKAPGQKPKQFIYDSRNRIVFTQDGNQAAFSTPQWTFTLYDALDRPSITALYNTAKTRAQLQTDVDNAEQVITVNDTLSTSGIPNDLVITQRDPSIDVYKARNSITFMPGFQAAAGDAFTAEIDPNSTGDSVVSIPVAAVFHNPIPSAAFNNTSITAKLKYLYYDNYAYSGAKAFKTSFENTSAYSNGPDVLPIAKSKRTTGMLTGTKVRILGTGTFLTSTYYYDEKGHLIQSLKGNNKGGTDFSTFQYAFDGRLLSVDNSHANALAGFNNFHVLTKHLFDKIGRVTGIEKKLGTGAWKNLASYTYDDMGRLKSKTLSPDFTGGSAGPGIESLDYSYNIHDQITGVNKDYALKTSGVYSPDNHFFGYYLGYANEHNVFDATRLDGHITGQVWNSKTDDIQRKYNYSYDKPGRLSGAGFTQYSGGSWNNSTINFTTTNITYDADGNLLHTKRYGLKGSTSPLIDNLSYTYRSFGNQLLKVTDAANDPNTTLGDFHDGSNSGNDYAYDANGNLTKDLNKGISSISYNYLNKPVQISFTGKGNIRFVYDADGRKLQKMVTDNTASPARTVTTSYVDGFVYKYSSEGQPGVDTLQFFPTEEGRVRFLPLAGGGQGWAYDYFVRDHLGNVRMVLTEQTDRTQYLATMETQNAPKENALFYNLNSTRVPKPLGYPQDNITTPNRAVAKLNGNDPDKRIGPSIILKVMAGDTLQAAVRAYYKKQATPKKVNIPAAQMLAGLVQALVSPLSEARSAHEMTATSSLRSTAPGLTAADLQSLRQKNPDNKEINKPRAYLNYVFFDKQLNFVSEGSGLKQVNGEPGQLETLASGKIVAKKDGYVYVFTSNESQQDVFFDNMSVYQSMGPILEETEYYPFGLTMAGISTVAPLKLANQFRYNGKLLNHKEFSDDTGLDWYSYGFRTYDPQTGRFIQQDPLTGSFATVSPYQYALNDPVENIDAGGLAGLPEVVVSAIGSSLPHSLGLVLSKVAPGVAKLAGSVPALSSVATTLSVAGKVGTWAHLGFLTAHALLILGEVEGVRGVGEQAAHPQDWYVNKKTGKLKYFEGAGKHAGYTHLGGDDYTFSGPTLKELVVTAPKNKIGRNLSNSNNFDPTTTIKANYNFFTTPGVKMDFFSTETTYRGTSPVELIIALRTKKQISTSYHLITGTYTIGMDGSFSFGNGFLSIGSAANNIWNINLSLPTGKNRSIGTSIYYNP